MGSETSHTHVDRTLRHSTRRRPRFGVAVVGLATAVSLSAGGALPSASATKAPPRAVAGALSNISPPGHQVTPSSKRGTFKTAEKSVAVVVGPNDDVKIDIDATLWKPNNATKRKPKPAILMTHGFGGTKDNTEILTTAEFFASNGYTVLTYTSSGFGASGGCVSLQSRVWDVKAARQLIDTVLEPRRDVLHDKRGAVVGTIGGSYGGGFQLPLASKDDRIRAAIPGRTWGQLQYSLDPNNRIESRGRNRFDHQKSAQGVFKAEWTNLFYALGNSQPASGNGGCPEAKAAAGDPEEIAAAGSCPGYYLELCATYESLSTTGEADDDSRALIKRSSAIFSKVKAAVLLVQGQADTLFNLNDAVSTYAALRRLNKPVGMIWNSGGHGGYQSQPGECEAYDGQSRSLEEMSNCYLPLRALGWMDHYLKGKKGGRGPGFTYYRDWKSYKGTGPNDEQYGTARRFPAQTDQTYFLSGSSELTTAQSQRLDGSASIINPPGGTPAAYSESSNFSGPGASPQNPAEPEEIAGQFAAFTAKPFPRAVTSVGVPSARLTMSHLNGQDLVFYAKVYDVAPGGSSELIHRLIAPVRVPAAEVDQPVRFHLAGFAHRFKKGHSVRLVLATTDQTSYNSKVADTITIASDGASKFYLPTKPR